MPSMASSSFLQLLLLAITATLSAALQNSSSHEGCIHLPVIHSTNPEVFSKRAIAVQLANRSDVAYYAKLEIGTPPQPVYVQLDTGSFELWVNPTCTNLGLADARFCEAIGFYDTAQSSTVESLGTTKTLRYGIGEANITYVKDDISLPGATSPMKAVQFGVATSSESQFAGILGIGYGLGLTTRYRNFVDELAAQNQTKVKAFSLALGGKDEQEGVIVFGGVDTSKFAGSLAQLPIVDADKSPDGVPRYWVSMESMALSAPSAEAKVYTNSSYDVFLDSGATLTLLPETLASEIAADFGATGMDANGFYPVDCGIVDVNGTLDFAFNGVTIKVPYSELIRQSNSIPPKCVLGIVPSSDFTLLGDTFLRSAYAVFDLENHMVYMQQYTNCGSTPAALADSSALTSLVVLTKLLWFPALGLDSSSDLMISK
ncbi:putative secreted aspartic proteinase protein [Phaeoacremonium minimum UCRPA7]|uniref:Putative secreted aspartic proteinase protein n=1 Tax=Phaeoacremonium minimum (strain UCR-PA7) TaxID=1286976 RepID=R8BIP1_PHAM7|nr:putative secreted aspartic proteinase protein [Phaeoacremonium minimum UCRPA7]EON99112.1 putative secreted aspartic proteinase protein [Phaeoacremonium minimum UCRPA7]